MQKILLKSKIHRAKITQSELYYEGSLTIDEELMQAANICEYEKVAVVNINNGERFETYVITGKKGSKVICLNGAAARKGAVGDEIIIISYGFYDSDEVESHKPIIILVDKQNNIIDKSSNIHAGKVFNN